MKISSVALTTSFYLLVAVGACSPEKAKPTRTGSDATPTPSSTLIPTYTPPPSDGPLTPVGNMDPDQLEAGLAACNATGKVYVVTDVTGRCVDKATLAPSCTYANIKTALKTKILLSDADIANIDQVFANTRAEGGVLDQCGIFGDSGLLVTHRWNQAGSGKLIGHWRHIFCTTGSGKPGEADCAALSANTEYFKPN